MSIHMDYSQIQCLQNPICQTPALSLKVIYNNGSWVQRFSFHSQKWNSTEVSHLQENQLGPMCKQRTLEMSEQFYCQMRESHVASEVKNHHVFEFLLVLPQCVYAVHHLGHVFAIIHICRFRIEYLKVEITIEKSHSSCICDPLFCCSCTVEHHKCFFIF